MKKNKLFLLAVFLPLLSHAQPLGFDGCMAHYASGASGWCQISDDVFENVRLSDAEANAFGVKGNVGSRAVMIAWNGGAFDPDTLTMYFHGGGHNDYYGNEWYTYDIQAGAFSRLNDPSPLTHYYYEADRDRYCRVPDPALFPMSAHTYDGVQFFQETGTIFIVNQGASQFCSSTPPEELVEVDSSVMRNFYEFNPSPMETRNGIPPLSYRNHGRHVGGYPRSTVGASGLVLGSNRELFEYTLIDNQLVQGERIHGRTTAGQGFAESINGVVVTYLNAGYLWTIDDNGSVNHIRSNKAPNHGGMACGVTECLFWQGATNVTLWSPENPTEWVEIAYENGPTDGDSRVYSKWQYIPSHDVYVGVSNRHQPVWLYKVPGSDPVDPPIDPVDPPVDPVDPPADPGFSEWMVDPDWSTFTVHPPLPGLQDEIITVDGNGVRFTLQIDKDIENNVYIIRAVGQTPLASITPEEWSAILSGFNQ